MSFGGSYLDGFKPLESRATHIYDWPAADEPIHGATKIYIVVRGNKTP